MTDTSTTAFFRQSETMGHADLYHGTSSDAADSIEQDGLYPAAQGHPTLTTSWAEAETHARNTSSPTILHFRVPHYITEMGLKSSPGDEPGETKYAIDGKRLHPSFLHKRHDLDTSHTATAFFRRAVDEPGPKVWKHKHLTYGPDGGYVEKESEVYGPLYHGGGKRLREGDQIKPGRKTNSWGDEGAKSTHVYFTTHKDTAASYAQQSGGHVYEVEPTGDFKGDYNGGDYKTQHPLNVVRKLDRSEWDTGKTAAVTATAFFRQSSEHPGPFFHGTRYPFKPGDLIEPGHKSNQGYGQPNPHVFFTHRPEIAKIFADSADDPEGHEGARPRVYEVEPTGPHEMDTDELPRDAKAAGSRQSRHPLRVVQEHHSTYEPGDDDPDYGEFEHEGCEECGESMEDEPHCKHCGYGHHASCCEEGGSGGHHYASTATEFFQQTGAVSHLDLYHRTTPEAADAIYREKRMLSRENGPVYFSTHRGHEPDSQAIGYGEGVVHVRVPEHLAQIDDEFPSGEQHYQIHQRDLRPEHFIDDRAQHTAAADHPVQEIRLLGALIARQAATDSETGIMVAIVPPREIAEQLAREGGEPVGELHITLAYLGKISDYTPELVKWLPELVGSWAARQKAIRVRIGGVLKFSNEAENQHVLAATADIPGGAQLHSDLAAFLTGHGYRLPSEHGWLPHLTLAYVDRHFRFLPKMPEHEWIADRVWTSVGPTWTAVMLDGIPH
ncbi:NAD(+)--rifampin ADP-ribosyltransferase [Streptomyces sp. NPDC008079]|uniref:NAD(+)--rifampin ADP-ribosyltransferase n=1 Tax=Streptomyces sp. NPDC008079 TaxID=3364806 RepID=UPI0036EE9928